MKVRKIDLPFLDSGVPRWWLHDNPVLTHFGNGLNLLFAPGERFFIRSVKHYESQLDAELRARVRTFYGQEGRHGHEHERANRMLRAQGYDIDTFLRIYETVAFEMLERVFPANLRLSCTVACEHFTATLARRTLSDEFLDGAHPTMAKLLRWHAAEELEHKSVAFDVLAEVDPRRWVRGLGLAIATSQLIGWWIVGAAMLRRQESLSRDEWRRFEAEAMRLERGRGQGDLRALFREAIVEYLEPSFHPDDHRDDARLAAELLQRLEAEERAAA